MIVTTLDIQGFDAETAKRLVSRLTELSRKLGDNPPPGLLDGKLLRENAHDGSARALLMVSWRSQLDLQRFTETELGQEFARSLGEVAGKNSEARDYFVTWQTEQPWSGQSPCNAASANGKDWS